MPEPGQVVHFRKGDGVWCGDYSSGGIWSEDVGAVTCLKCREADVFLKRPKTKIEVHLRKGDGAWCGGTFAWGEWSDDRLKVTCEKCREASFGKPVPVTSPLSTQVGGNHYKDMPIQPVEFIHKNGIGFCAGAAIKYLSRWNKPGCGGVKDLEKARHFIDILIELETKPNA